MDLSRLTPPLIQGDAIEMSLAKPMVFVGLNQRSKLSTGLVFSA